MGFLKCLFPVCFFWCFWTFARIDYQYFTISKQILKKKIMMVVCAASFSAIITILLFFFFFPLSFRKYIVALPLKYKPDYTWQH